MTKEWYYVRDGQRHGPITFDQMKGLAASGELQPSDLVWTEGKDEWKPASIIKGLFPTEPSSKRPPPVPVPSSAADTGTAPALWNPKALRAWNLLFTWGFGAFLLARNWKALGDEGRAKRAMYWFYLAIAFLVLAFLTLALFPTGDNDPSHDQYRGTAFGASPVISCIASITTRCTDKDSSSRAVEKLTSSANFPK